MNDSGSKKVLAYLKNEHHQLKAIFAKIQELAAFNEHFTANLDPKLKGLCQIVNIANGKLTLITANSAIAMEIRFQSSEIIRKLKQNPLFTAIDEIHCKVHPTYTQSSSRRFETAANTRPMIPLSTETASIVQEIAESIEDPKLRAALLKIATYSQIIPK